MKRVTEGDRLQVRGAIHTLATERPYFSDESALKAAKRLVPHATLEVLAQSLAFAQVAGWISYDTSEGVYCSKVLHDLED